MAAGCVITGMRGIFSEWHFVLNVLMNCRTVFGGFDRLFFLQNLGRNATLNVNLIVGALTAGGLDGVTLATGGRSKIFISHSHSSKMSEYLSSDECKTTQSIV